jgi:hypothetical protein
MGGDIDLLIPVDHDVEMTARLTFSQGELPNMDDYVMIQTLSKKLVVNVKFPKQGLSLRLHLTHKYKSVHQHLAFQM